MLRAAGLRPAEPVRTTARQATLHQLVARTFGASLVSPRATRLAWVSNHRDRQWASTIEHENVGSGSNASPWASANDFRSTRMNGHHQTGCVSPVGASSSQSTDLYAF